MAIVSDYLYKHIKETQGEGFDKEVHSLVQLTSIKGDEFSDTADTLHSIKQDAGQLNDSIISNGLILENTTLSGSMEYKKLYIMNEATLDCDGYNVYIEDECKITSAQLINCGSLTIKGDLTVQRKIGDVTFTNVLTVDELHVSGDALVKNATWTPEFNIRQIFQGDLITSDISDGIWNTDLFVGGNFSCNFTTVTKTNIGIDWLINGDANFNDFVSMTCDNCMRALTRICVNGAITFNESAISFSFNGDDGDAVNYGNGGGYIGATVGTNIYTYSGVDGTWNGGGSGSHSHMTYGVSLIPGAGSGLGGDGGLGGAGNTVTPAENGFGGGGGGGSTEFQLHANSGSLPTVTVSCVGGNGGSANSSHYGRGGGGGSAGPISLTHGTTAFPSNLTCTAGTNGVDGDGATVPVAASGTAYGTSSTVSTTLLEGYVPFQPIQVTEDGSTTSNLVFNIPIDINGSTLDFLVEIDELITGIVYDSVISHDTNNDSSYFSGTAPYAEGTGTITYTPVGFTTGNEYRWRVTAMKDSDTTLCGLTSPWRSFTYTT